jgi:murein DD-endopeptidase MepM/ murein hydrolase activator NlpD
MLLVRICRLTCVAAALAAGCLIAAMPHRARAAGDDSQTTADRCFGLAREAGHPPVNVLPTALRVLQRSLEPVPATDGLIHLAYAAQMTNTLPTPLEITGVVPVDPLADFSPTGRNHVVDAEGRDITGMVQLFDTSAAGGGVLPVDGPEAGSSAPSGFSTQLPPGNSGLMYFDVTYTDPAQIPRLFAHAITVAVSAGGASLPARYAAAGDTDPVPVGCRPVAVLHPPLVGHGWFNANGCCTIIGSGSHRANIYPINGVLQAFEQFAIDYIQIGPNGTCCNGPPLAPNSWWGYGTPILAAAPGVVVEVVDGLPDQQPVGTVSPDLPLADFAGNSVIEDIGGGRYIGYAHMQPGSIPASVRDGAPLRAGDLIGRVGNSGNSSGPHLHFHVMDRPSFLDDTALPFVFDTQLLEGTVTNGDLSGGPVTIDRTGAGQQSNRMPLETQVFGYNLSQ